MDKDGVADDAVAVADGVDETPVVTDAPAEEPVQPAVVESAPEESVSVPNAAVEAVLTPEAEVAVPVEELMPVDLQPAETKIDTVLPSEVVVSPAVEEKAEPAKVVEQKEAVRDAMTIAQALDHDVLVAAAKILSVERLALGKARLTEIRRERMKKTHAQILACVRRRHGGVKLSVVAAECCLAPKMASYHLSLMTKAGSIRAEGQSTARRFKV